MIKLIGLILLCISTSAVMSQPINVPNFCFKNFDAQDRFPEKYIYSITQDTNGQIWVGTSTGLYTYDNRFFKKYEPNFTVKNRSINNILQVVYYDSLSHKIWCGSYNCFLWFDPYAKKFISPNYDKPQINKLADDFITAFCRDKKKRMWIGNATNGWCLYNQQSDSITYFKPEKSTNLAVTKILQTKDGRIWVSTSDGLYETSKGVNNIQRFPSCVNNFQGNYMNNMVYDTNWNCLWIATGGEGLLQFDLATNKFIQHSFPVFVKGKKIGNGVVTGIGIINEDWLILDKNFYFNITQKKQYNINPNSYSTYNFNYAKLVNTFIDAEANMWLCTHNGLSLLPWQNRHVVNTSFSSPTGITHGFDRALFVNKNEVLVQRGFAPSLLIVNTINNQSRDFDFFKGKISKCISRYSNKEILIAVQNEIYNYNTSTSELKKIFESKEGDVNSIFVSATKEIFIAIEKKGIYHLKNDNTAIQIIVANKQNIFEPKAIDAQNCLWYMADEKLYYFNIFKSINSYASKVIPVQKLESFKIVDICADNNKNIWLTTKGNGIYFIKTSSESYEYKNFNSQNCQSILSDFASYISKDNRGNIWIGFLDGLSKWNPNTQTSLLKLNEQYGLFTNGLDPQDYHGQSNKLLLSTWSELTTVDLNTIGSNLYKNKLIFTDINIGGLSYDEMPAEIRLPYNKAFFSFNVGSTGYNNGNQNKIFYRLSRINEQWQDLGINYNINFTGLNNGTYTLYLKYTNNENEQFFLQSIKIKITPPFYKTWWFVLLSLLLLGSVIYYFYKLRLIHARREASMAAHFKQLLSETEMKALRAQMNPHFIFNTLNSINKFILQKDTVSASQYLTKFARLIRLILDDSNEKKVTLYSEIELLNLYLEMESVRFDKKFGYIINVSPELNTSEILLPSMLIQPYIENAIWHGLLHLPEDKLANSKIILSFEKHNDVLQVSIEDNGVGRTKAMELKSKSTLKKKSYGMKLTQNRIDILNSVQNANAKLQTIDLYNEQNMAVGTKVIITLPLENQN